MTPVSEIITVAMLHCKVKLFRKADQGLQVLLLKSYSIFNKMLVQLEKSQTNNTALV